MWITNGAQADWICLLANTSDGAPHRNKSLICVPMDTPGVTVARKIQKLGEGGRGEGGRGGEGGGRRGEGREGREGRGGGREGGEGRGRGEEGGEGRGGGREGGEGRGGREGEREGGREGGRSLIIVLLFFFCIQATIVPIRQRYSLKMSSFLPVT